MSCSVQIISKHHLCAFTHTAARLQRVFSNNNVSLSPFLVHKKRGDAQLWYPMSTCNLDSLNNHSQFVKCKILGETCAKCYRTWNVWFYMPNHQKDKSELMCFITFPFSFSQADFLKGLPVYNKSNFSRFHADSVCKASVSGTLTFCFFIMRKR